MSAVGGSLRRPRRRAPSRMRQQVTNIYVRGLSASTAPLMRSTAPWWLPWARASAAALRWPPLRPGGLHCALVRSTGHRLGRRALGGSTAAPLMLATGQSFGCRALVASTAPELRLPLPGALHRARGSAAAPWRRSTAPEARAVSSAAPWWPPLRPSFGCRVVGGSTAPEARLPRPGGHHGPELRPGGLHRARASAAAPWCSTALGWPPPARASAAVPWWLPPRRWCWCAPPRRWCWCAPPRPRLGCCPGACTAPELRLPRPGGLHRAADALHRPKVRAAGGRHRARASAAVPWGPPPGR